MAGTVESDSTVHVNSGVSLSTVRRFAESSWELLSPNL